MYYVEDNDILCKCLNLLYLIKELILCGLTTHSGMVNVQFMNTCEEQYSLFLNVFISLINQ